MSRMRFFKVDTRPLWGDYGDVLINGYAHRRGKNSQERLFNKDAPLMLKRTGPFIPPISLPGYGDLVISNSCKRAIEAGKPRVQFLPVIKKRIVENDWHTWDLTGEPIELPYGGEPENYLNRQPHSVRASALMGDVWELPLEQGAQLNSNEWLPMNEREIFLDYNTWTGQHVFSIDGGVYVSEAGRNWLLEYADGWLVFEEIAVAYD